MARMMRLHLLISGRVQGVFFRAYTQKKAVALGLTGFVQNLANGQVEVVAEGLKERLQLFLDWCHKGSPASKVTSVKETWQPATGEYADFSTQSSPF